MHALAKSLAATAMLFLTAAPAAAQWTYSVERDDRGLEYAKVSVRDINGNASIYTECTRNLSMGLALILPTSQEMIEQFDGQAGYVLYMNEAGDGALATVGYAAGEGTLHLVSPDPGEIESVWKIFNAAEQSISVRFTFPPAPQVYELVFPIEGAAEALGQLDAYCQ